MANKFAFDDFEEAVYRLEDTKDQNSGDERDTIPREKMNVNITQLSQYGSSSSGPLDDFEIAALKYSSQSPQTSASKTYNPAPVPLQYGPLDDFEIAAMSVVRSLSKS
jgi:hypothetical protein